MAAACWCLSCSLYSLLHHSHLSARTLVASLQPSTAPLYSDSRHVFHLEMCTIQLCSKKRQEGSPRQIVQRQAEFGECQILARVPTALVDAPQAHTRSSIIYSHVWMWGSTSSWAPRGDLRHFSREEEEEEASRRACHLSIAHVRQYTPAASRQTDEADNGDA